MPWIWISSLFLFISVLIRLWRLIRFLWKYAYIFLAQYAAVLFLFPITLRKPGDVENNILPSKFITFLLKPMGVKYELRGIDHFAADEASVMAPNHQDMFDITAAMAHAEVIGRFTLALKKTMLYHPAGILSALYGVVFIDRAGGTKTREAVNSWAFEAREKKFKVIIFPEGTRNFFGLKSQCFLPFRKGCFHAAIAAQIPIRPVVYSPYYFINLDRLYFGRGRVIFEALPAIPTTGMTSADVGTLMQQTRTVMTLKYRQLTEEVLSTLPLTHPCFEWINDVE